MTFFNFTLPAADGSSLVDEQVHLNDNWDKLDSRLTQLQSDTTNTIAAPIPVGTEALVNGDVQVWTGNAWRGPDNIPASWNAWYTLPIAGVVARAGYEPRVRVNTMMRKTMIVGGVQYDAAASVWPAGEFQITSDTSGLDAQYAPQSGPVWAYGGASQSTSGGTTDYSGSRVKIEKHPTAAILKVTVQHQGLYDGGGNFIMLDGIGWFW